MVKRVTDDELAEMRKIGSVEYDPETREVARFGELIEKLELMIAADSERTKADLARSQVQLEIIASLQKMIRANGTKSQVTTETIDLQPLRDILAEVTAVREAVPYRFDIKRGAEGGPMQQVIATPIPPTLN